MHVSAMLFYVCYIYILRVHMCCVFVFVLVKVNEPLLLCVVFIPLVVYNVHVHNNAIRFFH